MAKERHLFTEFTKGNRRLPSELKFLKQMDYNVHAITKYDSGNYRVELHAKRLKYLLLKSKELERLKVGNKWFKDRSKEEKRKFKKEIARLQGKESLLEKEKEQLEKQIQNLKMSYDNSQSELSKACKAIQENFAKASRGEKSPKSYMNKIEEDKNLDERKAVQGGLAGL